MGKQNNVISFQDLKLNKKHGPISLALFKKQYESNEDINDHSLNVLLCAFFAGSTVDLYIARRIYLEHEKAGHISPDLLADRDRLMAKLSPALRSRGAAFAAVGYVDPIGQEYQRLSHHRINVENILKNAGLSIYQFDRCLADLSNTAAPAFCRRLYFWALYRAFVNEFLSMGRFCEYVQQCSGSLESMPTRTALFYALAVGRDLENKING